MGLARMEGGVGMMYLLTEEQMHELHERLGAQYIHVQAAIADDWWEKVNALWVEHCLKESEVV